MTKLIIKSLTFNDQTTIALNDNDIVVFVGPNNVGKSQSLHDIYNLLSENNGIVVKSIEKHIENKEDIEEVLSSFSIIEYGDYSGAQFKIYSTHLNEFKKSGKISKGIADFLCSLISTKNRLSLIDPQEKVRDEEAMKHPLHYLERNRDLLPKMKNAFHEAFGSQLLLNDYDGKYISFSIDEESVIIPEGLKGSSIDEVNMIFKNRFKTLKKLHNQGDGMKSYTGVLLNTLVPHYSSFFIDEPESFLHPPQAYIMGRQIGEMATGKQLFLSTHSESFLKGLMDNHPERLKIIRITRNEDKNSISILDNQDINKIWNDPLLRYSNVINSLFYQTTVICESNTDCKFYRMMNDQINAEKRRIKDILFIECGGKQRFHIIYNALKSLNIDFRSTPDFDIFRKDSDAKLLYESCGGNWKEDCDELWKEIETSLPETPNEINKEIIRTRINNYLDGLTSSAIGSQDKRNLKKLLEGQNKWDILKENGLNGIPDSEAKKAAQELLKVFNKVNIFPVPVGEMENLVPGTSKHGKEWLNYIINIHPDLSDDIYNDAKDYVRALNL